jgi:hypothetical protein
MASEEKVPLQKPSSESSSASRVKENATQERHFAQARESEPLANGASDFFLFHSTADRLWTKELAERLQEAPIGNRNLQLSLTTWNSARGAHDLVEVGESLRGHCHMGIVVSRGMLLEDWPAAKKTIESLKELSLAKGRIVTILKENVTIPPMLRLGEWFDFRNENHFEENLLDLTSFLREDLAPAGESSPRSADLPLDSAKGSASVGSLYSFGVCSAKERILSNLFPVVELPKFVFSGETQFQTEAELTEACGGVGPSPFLLKGSRLYTLEPLSQDSAFARAMTSGDAATQENFTQWFSRNDRAGWALELLNNLFRNHAWKRALRWDKSTEQYYFPRARPKNVWWEISKQTISRVVIAPHMGWTDFENQVRAEAQYGWRHRSLRADFVQVMDNVCLRLEPSWLLTELDGETPATTRRVGPVLSGALQQERNGPILRSLRFWSAVLAKGHHEIRINTGQAPVRIKLTPVSGSSLFGMRGDKMEYDQLMLTEMEDDLVMPALEPLEQEIISHEEDICSEAVREIRSE